MVTFRKPGPETSMSLITSPDSTFATTCVASSLGFAFAFLASARMPFAWKSARSLRRSSGSAEASGRVAEIAELSCWLTESLRDVTGAMGVGAVLLGGSDRHRQYPMGGKAVFSGAGRSGRMGCPSSLQYSSTSVKEDVPIVAQSTETTDWVSRFADEVIEESERRAPGKPVVVASGLSPSGPIHLGNLREVMTPHLVADEIRRRGRQVRHLISWDDYDRYRKVPKGIAGVDEDTYKEHIGKPLTSVPAPKGSAYPNWAEHFKAAMIESLAELGVEFDGISQTAQYTSGVYREQILHAMKHRGEIDAVLDQYRTKKASAKKQQQKAVDEAELEAEEG